MVSLSIVTASPLPLLLQHPGVYTQCLGNAVDISALTAYGDEHKRELITDLVNGLDIANDILVIPNVKNKIPLAKLVVGNGFRPYSKTKEFKAGQLAFSDRMLITQTGKRELQIDYREFKDSYLAWRTTPGNSANKDFNSMEFAPWVWKQVFNNVKREINDETAYFGFDKADAVAFDIGDPYAIGDYVTFTQDGVLEYFLCIDTAAAGDSPDTDPEKWRNVTARAVVPGIKAYLDEAIDDTDLTEEAIGAIASAADAKAGFKELFRTFNPAIKQFGVVVHASYTDCEYLLDGLEDLSKYTMPDVSALVKAGLIPIPGTNFKGWAKPATWLGDSRRLIAEPMMPGTNGVGMNLVLGTDLLSDMNDIATTKELWTIDTGIAVDLGFQIQDLAALRINDQD